MFVRFSMLRVLIQIFIVKPLKNISDEKSQDYGIKNYFR